MGSAGSFRRGESGGGGQFEVGAVGGGGKECVTFQLYVQGRKRGARRRALAYCDALRTIDSRCNPTRHIEHSQNINISLKPPYGFPHPRHSFVPSLQKAFDESDAGGDGRTQQGACVL